MVIYPIGNGVGFHSFASGYSELAIPIPHLKGGITMKRAIRTVIIVLLAVFLSTPALAEESPDPKDFPWKRGYLNLGAYIATMDSAFRLGESNL